MRIGVENFMGNEAYREREREAKGLYCKKVHNRILSSSIIFVLKSMRDERKVKLLS